MQKQLRIFFLQKKNRMFLLLSTNSLAVLYQQAKKQNLRILTPYFLRFTILRKREIILQ